MSANASSHVTSSNSPRGSVFGLTRRKGWSSRLGSWCTAPKDVPLWHAKPPETGWSRSGWIATTAPCSSVSATNGQSGSQIRQWVGVSVVPVPGMLPPVVRTADVTVITEHRRRTMGALTVVEFTTLDGVVQGFHGADERDGFRHS